MDSKGCRNQESPCYSPLPKYCYFLNWLNTRVNSFLINFCSKKCYLHTGHTVSGNLLRDLHFSPQCLAGWSPSFLLVSYPVLPSKTWPHLFPISAILTKLLLKLIHPDPIYFSSMRLDKTRLFQDGEDVMKWPDLPQSFCTSLLSNKGWCSSPVLLNLSGHISIWQVLLSWSPANQLIIAVSQKSMTFVHAGSWSVWRRTPPPLNSWAVTLN